MDEGMGRSSPIRWTNLLSEYLVGGKSGSTVTPLRCLLSSFYLIYLRFFLFIFICIFYYFILFYYFRFFVGRCAR